MGIGGSLISGYGIVKHAEGWLKSRVDHGLGCFKPFIKEPETSTFICFRLFVTFSCWFEKNISHWTYLHVFQGTYSQMELRCSSLSGRRGP